MNDDIRKLNGDELDTISGGKTNVPDFSGDPDDIPKICPGNITGKHTFVMKPNSLFEETCVFCGCKKQVSFSWSNPRKPTHT